MYILFTNSIGKCDIFFLLNLIIIIIINCLIHGFNLIQPNPHPTHEFNPTQPNSCELSWIGLDLRDELSWVDFFLPIMVS